MKTLILSLVTMLSALNFANAGRSTEVLDCQSSSAPAGFENVIANVFYEDKVGNFGGYLGFSSAVESKSSKAEDAATFYCFGGCSRLTRKTVGNKLVLTVSDEGSKLTLTIPSSLIAKGAHGSAMLDVDMTTESPRKTIPFHGKVNCKAGPDIELITSAGI